MIDILGVGWNIHVHGVRPRAFAFAQTRIFAVAKERLPAIEAPRRAELSATIEPANDPVRLWIDPLSRNPRREHHRLAICAGDREPFSRQGNQVLDGVVVGRIIVLAALFPAAEPIRRIGQAQVGPTPLQRSVHISVHGTTTADEPMPPEQPHIAERRHRDLRHVRHIVGISQPLGLFGQEAGEFVVVEAGQGEVEVEGLKLFEFEGQQIVVPARPIG